MLGALGVVFGDIGTSPLYALRQTVLATEGGLPNHVAVMGSLSMIFWALILVVTVKYVLIIMRADNNGEGGTLALAALAHRSPGLSRKLKTSIGIGAIVGLALFFGDGMLTPAITVLSAVEGLTVETPASLRIGGASVLAILVGLFALQSYGTHRPGGCSARDAGSGPWRWLRVRPLPHSCKSPTILQAVNPLFAVEMLPACALDRLHQPGRGGAGGDGL